MESATTTTPAATISSRLGLIARDIKISHTIFAMPFALLATFLAAASSGRLPSALTFGLIVICMVFARTAAMAFNRWADRHIDATNPRTKGRAIPSGKLPARFVLVVMLACAAAFIAATSAFWWLAPQGDANAWPLIASPLVLVWLCLYSLTKRFTWLCHVFLGSALALSPPAAALAVSPAFLAEPAVYLLALMVLTWVAGFDVIYALQDTDVDRAAGLHSMPASLGQNRALWISRALHVGTLVALIVLAMTSDTLGLLFAIAVGLVGILLMFEHALVWRSKTNHLNMAFFTVNGVISVVLGAAGIADVLIALSRA